MNSNITDTLLSQKISLRKDIKISIKNEIDHLHEKSAHIVNKILNMQNFMHYQTFFIYLSLQDEVNTFALLEALLNKGKTVCVPKIINNEMHPIEIHSLHDVQKGKYGILEPKSNVIFSQKIDIAFIPGRAFDTQKNRLWRGGGYYDTFLSQHNMLKVGICFDFQILDKIPKMHHDIAMDEIITEK